MAHLQFVDELVREYLCFRGFTNTLKSLDNDLKTDKDKGFRIDKVLDNILQNVYNYDLNGLRDTWSHLDNKIFSKLEQHFTSSIHKLENAVYKFYLVNACVNHKSDKVIDFFTKMTPELVGQNEWKDWFVLPYIKNPEENSTFALYFTKQWQDTLFVSLHNLLAAVYQSIQLPTLANYEDDAIKMSNLQKENELLRKGVVNMKTSEEKDRFDLTHELDPITDDFYNITQEIRSNENQSKMLRTIMRSVGAMPSSPKLSASTSGEETKKSSSKKFTSHIQAKRSLSTDARGGAGRSRERDSSLDTASRRSLGRDVELKIKPCELLILSQEEYNEHKSCITDIKFNSRGNYVASCDKNGVVKVWTVSPSCSTIASYNNSCTVLCVEWLSHLDRCVAFGDVSSTVKIFDIQLVKVVAVIGPDSCVLLKDTRIEQILQSQADTLLLVVASGKLLQFDSKTKKIEKCITTTGPVRCCCINNNNQVLTVCGDGCVELVDLAKNHVLKRYTMGNVQHAKFSPHDSNLFFALTDTFQLIQRSTTNAKDNIMELNLLGTGSPQNSAYVSQLFTVDNSGCYILTVGFNSGVVYKISDGEVSNSLELKGHKSPVTCLDWSFANQCSTCVTASSDGNIRLSTLLVETT